MILSVCMLAALASSGETFEGCLSAARSPKPIVDRQRSGDCGRATRDYILSSPSTEDRAAAWAAFDALPRDSEFRRSLLETFVLRRLYDATAHLPDPLPSTARVDLAGARADYQRLRDRPRSGETASPVVQPAISFREHTEEFEAALVAFVRGGASAAEAEAKLARFAWDGSPAWSADFHAPLERLSAARWAERGQHEAAVSTFFTSWWDANEDVDRVRRRLLAAAGLDWQRVYAGALLEDHAAAAVDLAREGAPTAARWLLAAAEPRSGFVFLAELAAFVAPPDQCSDTRSILGYALPPRTTPAPPELQASILAFLGRKAVGSALNAAGTAGELLAALCRPESVPVFRAMLRSPYEEVREYGRVALVRLEKHVPKVEPNPPVVFRLLVDGAPVTSRDIEWQLGGPGWNHAGSERTDGNGAIGLSRDHFLDPRARVAYVALSPGRPAVAGDTWFRSLVTSRDLADLAAVPPVSISTQSLSVRCASGRSLSIAVEASQDATGQERHVVVKRRPFTSPVHELPRLDRALRYHVTLAPDDGWTWRSPPVVLGDTPVVLHCKATAP